MIDFFKDLLKKTMVINSRQEEHKFNPGLIRFSLLRETDATEEEATKIMLETVRRIVGADIKTLTGPLIRELVNSVMLAMGFELYRAQYTRLGMPLYDLAKLIDDGFNGRVNVDVEVYKAVLKEYGEVLKMILRLKK